MAAAQEPARRDFYAEAQLLIRNVRAGTLATCQDGVPHAAWVTVAFAPEPVLLLSGLAVHTKQLMVNPACSLLLVGEAEGENPQTTPRLCLTGEAVRNPAAALREKFLEVHPYAGLYAGFGDFAVWGVTVTEAYYVGGFGAARRLEQGRLFGG